MSTRPEQDSDSEIEEETRIDDMEQADESEMGDSHHQTGQTNSRSGSQQSEDDEIARHSPFVPDYSRNTNSPLSSVSASDGEPSSHEDMSGHTAPLSYSGLRLTTRGYEVGEGFTSTHSSTDSADESTAFLESPSFVLESEATSAAQIELTTAAGDSSRRKSSQPPPYSVAISRLNTGVATQMETTFGPEVTTVAREEGRQVVDGQDEPPPCYSDVELRNLRSADSEDSPADSVGDVEANEDTTHCCRGFLNSLQCSCAHSKTKRCIILASVVTSLIVLFIVLFPIQFSYVSYYQFALVRTKSTGRVATDRVYEHGCYVLGADKEFVYLNRTVKKIEFNKIGMFTKDNVDLSIDMRIYYHLNYEDVGQLWRDYAGAHESVVEAVALTVIRNCAPRVTQDEYLKQREYVEDLLRKALDEKFANWGITISYMNYLGLYLPERVINKKLKLLLIRTDIEKEQAYQLQREIELETELLTTPVLYAAKEAINNGTVQAAAIKTIAEAEKSQYTDTAHASAFQSMMDTLNITQTDHALSFYYLATLNTMNHFGGIVDYAKRGAFSP